MGYENQSQLEEAKTLFYSWRLMDAYNILRRFFARLPFKPEDDHAEYIGMFARTLAELGKTRELLFYMGELERLYETTKSPAIAYQLGFVYSYLPEPRLKEARELFESVVRNPEAKDYFVKAKIMLADAYEKIDQDIVGARRIIDSIGTPKDRHLRVTVEIWKGLLLRHEGKEEESEALLVGLIRGMQMPEDWYLYFSAKNILTKLYLMQGRYSEAANHVRDLRRMFARKHFRTITEQIHSLEKMLRETPGLGTLYLEPGRDQHTLRYFRGSFRFASETVSDRFLLMLVKKGFVEKEKIVKSLLERKYRGTSDDRWIQTQVQVIRKRLKKIGLPPDAILRETKGYRLVPTVEVLETLQ